MVKVETGRGGEIIAVIELKRWRRGFLRHHLAASRSVPSVAIFSPAADCLSLTGLIYMMTMWAACGCIYGTLVLVRVSNYLVLKK